MAEHKLWQFGTYTLPKRGSLSDTRYAELVYETNQVQFEAFYNKELQTATAIEQKARTDARYRLRNPGAIHQTEQFVQQFPNAKALFLQLARSYTEVVQYEKGTRVTGGITKTGIEKAIQLRFGEEIARFQNNVLKGLQTYGVYNDFIKLIREPVNANKLVYVGDGVYTYETFDGRVIKITLTNSPMAVFVEEENA